MIGMRIWMVMMPVVMIVIMDLIMAMVMTMMMVVMIHIQPTGPGAEMVAPVAILDIASRR